MFPVDEYLSQHFVLPNILILIIPGVLLGLPHNLKLISLIISVVKIFLYAYQPLCYLPF